ncbi:MAG: hypothetical protein NTU51_02610 [Bacteroidetes bacterium]|nr:hypothetical protein [Bacteroidota bacterium]
MVFGFVVVDEAKVIRHEGLGKLFSACYNRSPLKLSVFPTKKLCGFFVVSSGKTKKGKLLDAYLP